MSLDRYAVFGNPIAHSKSPLIHACFAQECAQQMSYTAECIAVDAFQSEVMQFFSDGGKGLNVTVPFKEAAWQLAAVRSEQAELAGAVNTLYQNAQGQICGDNTDGVGLIRDITQNHSFDLNGKKVLVLGAGGAVRGVLRPLLAESPAQVVVANRTLSKAEALAQLFSDFGEVKAAEFSDCTEPFDFIINGTSASLQGDLPPLPSGAINQKTWVYDMMYGAEPTPFMRWASQQGSAQQIDGLGMLVEQAAEAFSLWRGVRPDAESVICLMRSKV